MPCSPNPCVSVCPPANPCTLDFTVSGPNGYNETIVGFPLQDGTDCAGAGAVGTWTLTPWLGDDPINGGCYSTTCGQHFDICDDPDVHSCRCGMVGTWRSDEAHNRSRVQLRLAKIIGDPLYPFDGWWLLAQVIEFYGDVTSGCIYGGCQFFEPTYFGVFLGADDSIFDTDLNVPLNLMAHAGNSGSCSVSDASLDVTFHPCV